jgi:outer membrane protein OmpA-like peptidoglycan-associated protein
MRPHTQSRVWVAGLLAPLAVLACVSTEPTPSVVEARQMYLQTAQDPKVNQLASEQLYEAQKVNDRMERALQRGRDEAEVDHLAYLVKRHTEIAKSTADAASMREQVKELGERRDQLRLDARSEEARRARGAAAAAIDVAAQRGAEVLELRERAAAAEEEASVLAAKLELNSKVSERGLVITLGDVLFTTGSAMLASGAERTLGRVAELLQKYPDRSVIVEGHTDDVGSNAYNEQLSRQRAQSVADALIASGVKTDRLQVRGLGESAPAVPNTNAASRQQNRRVEIVLSPAVAD